MKPRPCYASEPEKQRNALGRNRVTNGNFHAKKERGCRPEAGEGQTMKSLYFSPCVEQ